MLNATTGMLGSPGALQSPSGGLSPWFSPVPAVPTALPASPRWLHVRRRFDALLEAIAITPAQAEDGLTKIGGITACLNRAYWGTSHPEWNAVLAGSWAKLTRVRPAQDIDLIFILPVHDYHRFEARTGNRQSQLLQEVKAVLGETYSRTEMRGDGQVVVIRFDSIKVEVVPAFQLDNGQLWTCDTNDGGRYVVSDPWAQASALSGSDTATNGNTRHLTRLAKLWAREQAVPLKSYLLERLAIEFLATWSNAGRDTFWYDWMMRDFFAYLITRANTSTVIPGTQEWVWLGDAWHNKAKSAHAAATAACQWEDVNLEGWAADAWRGVFGAYVRPVLE